MFLNNDTGEVLNYFEARMQWMNEYDGEDDSSCISFDDQYSRIED